MFYVSATQAVIMAAQQGNPATSLKDLQTTTLSEAAMVENIPLTMMSDLHLWWSLMFVLFTGIVT